MTAPILNDRDLALQAAKYRSKQTNLAITGTASAFLASKNSVTILPQTIVLTATPSGSVFSSNAVYTWSYALSSAPNTWITLGTGKTWTLNSSDSWITNASVQYRCIISENLLDSAYGYYTVTYSSEGAESNFITLSRTNVLVTCDANGTPISFNNTDITIAVSRGTTNLAYSTNSTTPNSFTVSIADDGNLTRNLVGTYTSTSTSFTMSGISALALDGATITFTINVYDSSATPVATTYTRKVVYNKVNNGVVGSSARAVDLTIGTQAFAYLSDGSTPSPANTVITATPQNTSGTVYYEFFVAGVSKQNTTTNTYTYTPLAAYASMPQQITVKIREGTNSSTILATDIASIIGIKPGVDSIVGNLSNPTSTVIGDVYGNVSSFANTSGTFYVYDGITNKTGDAAVTYSVYSSTGLTISIASTGVYTVSAMGTDVIISTAILRAVYKGVTIDLQYTMDKSKPAADGSNINPLVNYDFAGATLLSNVTFPGTVATYETDTATLLTNTVIDQNLRLTNLDLVPNNSYIISMRVKWVSGAWEGFVFYANPSHGESGNYYKAIPQPALDVWTTINVDMRSLTAGGTEYLTGGNITQLRFDFINAVSASVAVDYISIGKYGIAEGKKSITLSMYYWAVSAPAYSGAFTYNWNTAAISAYPSGWSAAAGAAPGNGYTLYQRNITLTDTTLAATTNANWSGSSVNTIGYRNDGTIGVQGDSYRIAYIVTTSSTPPAQPGVTTAPAVPNGWSATATATLTDGQYMYQSDGIYSANTTNITWGIPYLSNLKVGSLSALSANLGVVSIASSGALWSGKSTFANATNAGFFLGNDSGNAKFRIGNADNSSSLAFDSSTGVLTLKGGSVFNAAGATLLSATTVPDDINNSTAIATAASDATTKANAAVTSATTTAASDATTKANAAVTSATTTAASDATAKANAAAATAAADATAKANAAQTAANTAMIARSNAVMESGPSLALDVQYWPGANIQTITDGKEGNTVARSVNSTFYNDGIYHPLDTARKFKIRFWARAASGTNGILYFTLRQFKDNLGTPCDTNGGRSPYNPSGVTPHTDWRLYESYWNSITTWQANVKYIQPDWLGSYNGGGSYPGNAGYWEIQGFKWYDITEAQAAADAADTAATAAANAATAAANAASAASTAQSTANTAVTNAANAATVAAAAQTAANNAASDATNKSAAAQANAIAAAATDASTKATAAQTAAIAVANTAQTAAVTAQAAAVAAQKAADTAAAASNVLNYDPTCSDPVIWPAAYIATISGGLSGTTAIVGSTGEHLAESKQFIVDRTRRYRVTAYIRKTAGATSGTVYLGLLNYDINGNSQYTWGAYTNAAWSVASSLTTSFQTFTSDFAPNSLYSGTVKAAAHIILGYPSTGGGRVEFQNVRVTDITEAYAAQVAADTAAANAATAQSTANSATASAATAISNAATAQAKADSAYDAATAANANANTKLSKSANDTLSAKVSFGTDGAIVVGAINAATGVPDTGIFIGPNGIVGRKTGTTRFSITSAGDAYFGGELQSATGTFSGALSAATGTFSGTLSAASGSFSGNLTAANIITTGNIQDNAVTSPVGALFSGSIFYSTGASIANASITTTGKPILVSMSALISPGFYYTGGNNGGTFASQVNIQIYRNQNGTNTSILNITIPIGGIQVWEFIDPTPIYGPFSYTFVDTPSAGTATYYLYAASNANATSVAQQRSASIIELKK